MVVVALVGPMKEPNIRLPVLGCLSTTIDYQSFLPELPTILLGVVIVVLIGPTKEPNIRLPVLDCLSIHNNPLPIISSRITDYTSKRGGGGGAYWTHEGAQYSASSP